MKQRANLRSPLFLQYASRPAEVEATNYATYSEQIDDASWSKSNTSVTANQIEAPDETNTADKVTHSGTASSNYVFKSGISVTSGQLYTFSIFAKSGQLSHLQLIPTTTQFGSTHQNYDLDNGDLGSSSGDITSSIENYGNGWYRCSISATCTTSGTGGILVSLARSSNENRLASFSSDGHIYLWGVQAEDNSLTSYIKTEATTVTRAATTAAQEEDVTAELRIYNGGGGYNYERTNYATNNTSMDTYSSVGGSNPSPTLTANYITAPDGTLTATRLQVSKTGTNYSLISFPTTALDGSGGGYYTASVYVKSNTGSSQEIAFYGQASAPNQRTVTTEWTRLQFTGQRLANTKYAYLGTINGTDDDIDISVWGAQIELNDLPVTSFIPTEATAVTELAYQTEAPTEATYTLTRTPNNAKATFEVSELVRDYIEQTLENTSGTTWLEVTLSDSIQLPRHYHFLCTEGYIDNTEGLQTYLNAPSNETFMQSNSTVLIPQGQYLELPVNAQYNSFYTVTAGGVEGSAVYFSNLDDNTTQIEYITLKSTDEVVKLYVDSVVTEEITIQETECSKYANNKLLFVNKYGAKQEFYVNMKSTEKIRVKDDGFSRNVIDYTNLSVTNGLHSYKRRVLESKEMHTLNTPFLDEENVQAFEELLLSEYVWYKKEGSDYIPVIIKDSNMTRKTHLNDKLIQYTIEVESANNLINIQR